MWWLEAKMGIEEIQTGAISPHFCTSAQGALNLSFVFIARENPRQMRELEQAIATTCTKSGHRLVDAVHSIDFTGDKLASFLLTQKLKGVEP
jgi:hypothetical protein